MEKHTPTPWKAQPFSGVNGKYVWEVIGAEGVVPQVCRLALVDAGPATVEANARFIERAVNNFAPMLAALEYMLENAEAEGWSDLRLDDARAAVKAAKGEA